MIWSPTFNDPNVLPAQVNTFEPLMFISSEGDNSLIGADFKTKSPLKSYPNPVNVDASW